MRFCTLCRRAAPGGASICSFDGHPLTSDVAVEPASGTTIGGYRLTDVVALGETGTVYRADDAKSGARVALKLLSNELCSTAAVMHRVRRETKNAIKLANPNVARVLDCGDYNGRFFIVREWLEGHPLSVLLSEEGTLSVVRASMIAYQVASALGLVHRVGVVHRDLKPNHIFLALAGDGTWMVKLIDIGVAAPVAGLQPTREILGTAAYLSPEQAEGKLVSFRSDLYSLGIVFQEMLVGAPPFTGDPLTVMEAHRKVSPPDLGSLRPDVPASLAQLVSKLLAKQAAARPFSASNVQRDLEKLVPDCKEPLAPVITGRGGVKASAAPSTLGSSQPQASAPRPEDMGTAVTLYGGTLNADMVNAAAQATVRGLGAASPQPASPPAQQPVQASPAPQPVLAQPAVRARQQASSVKSTILGLPVLTAEQLQATRQGQPVSQSSPPFGYEQGGEAAPEAQYQPAQQGYAQGAQPVAAQHAPPYASPAPGGEPAKPIARTVLVEGDSPEARQYLAAGAATTPGMGPQQQPTPPQAQPPYPQQAQQPYPQAQPSFQQGQTPPTTDELRQELKRTSGGKTLLIVLVVVLVLGLIGAILGAITCFGRGEEEPATSTLALNDGAGEPSSCGGGAPAGRTCD